VTPHRVRLFASFLLALGMLCLLEGAARLWLPAPSFWQRPDGSSLMPAHRYLLWVNAPGDRVEEGVPVHINSLGLRGPEPVRPKPAGERRLLVTGDSVVYGFGVPQEALLTSFVGERLGVEAWPVAVPGYSSLQALNLLQMTGLSLEPDLVLVSNMWSDLSAMGFRDRDLLASWESPPRSPLWWLSRHSVLFAGLRRGLHRLDGRGEARIIAWREHAADGEPGRRVPIEEYAETLDRIVDVCRAAGAEVGFLRLPIRASVKGLPPGGSQQAYAQVMADTAARRGSPLLDAATPLRAAGQPESALWRDATHLTAKGHAVVGAWLADQLAAWAAGSRVETAGTGQPRPRYVDPDPAPAPSGLKRPDDMIP